MRNWVIIISILLTLICALSLLKRKQNKHRICVLISGFAPRGLKYTYKTIQQRIIDKLKLTYDTVDVFHYSFISKNGKIDSHRTNEDQIQINNDDVNLLNVKQLRTDYQEDIKLEEYITKTCETSVIHPINPLRELYQEYMTSKFPIQNYDACVLLWSDGYMLRDINIEHVENVIANNNLLYTTGHNKWGGIANKFYISSPRIILLLAQRLFHLSERCYKLNGKKENPEEFLEWWVNDLQIENRETDMFYVKIRNNLYTTFRDKLEKFLKKNPSMNDLFELENDGRYKLKV